MPYLKQSTLDRLEANAAESFSHSLHLTEALRETQRQNAALLRLLAEHGMPAPPVFEPMPSVEEIDRKLAREKR